MSTFEWLSVGASSGIGLVQCGLIAWGLWMMREASQRRDRQLDALLKGLEAQSAGIRALLGRSQERSA